ncbi:MAG: lipid biosynthesis B12-binding/radical SAM protein, partial [Candidatus Omnitrophica bacterium]|nr:lipid biosynthesis B12-binding/radical SAM protein [Candidatus Omnitrophota bacterium]
MRIFLVSANTAESPYPVYPLGMGIVAHALMRAGHSVRQFDFLQAGRSCERLRAALREASPELVGISVRNIDNVNLVHEQRYLSVVRDIVREIRSVTGVPVLLGGSGFSVMPEAVLEAVQADYGIVGESEWAVVDFVERLSRGQTPQERCVRPSGVLPGDDISPACYDPRIMQFYLGRGNMAPIQTKRGCTYRCVYCTYPLLEGRTLRPRPAVDVVDDIGHLVNGHKAGYIFFTDSVFNDDRGHYRDILNEMKRRRLSVSWTAFIKPGRLSDSDVLLMKQTGLKAVELGSDAASDTALEGMGKDFLFSDV